MWHIAEGVSPLVATAIHNGHELREEVAGLSALSDGERLREEDPFTADWTAITDTRIIVTASRFEMDLNRHREKAVYIEPEDAWGLKLWENRPSPEMVARSLDNYDKFYAEVQRFFSKLEHRFGRFVVFDLHTYNHRRGGPDAPAAELAANPEVNVGTGTMDRKLWAPVVDRFIAQLRSFDFLGRRLDVRENVKFQGGHFSRWIHQTFPRSGCALAIEFKKFFMDEWTGTLDQKQHAAVHDALKSTVPAIMGALSDLSKEK